MKDDEVQVVHVLKTRRIISDTVITELLHDTTYMYYVEVRSLRLLVLVLPAVWESIPLVMATTS